MSITKSKTPAQCPNDLSFDRVLNKGRFDGLPEIVPDEKAGYVVVHAPCATGSAIIKFQNLGSPDYFINGIR